MTANPLVKSFEKSSHLCLFQVYHVNLSHCYSWICYTMKHSTMCKVLSCCLMKHNFLLPVRQFLQTWGLHFSLVTRAQPWAQETAAFSSKGLSFCYFCTSFSNPVEFTKTDQMKAMVRFRLFSPIKSYEKLVFVVCGVTVELHCHLCCCNHTVQETLMH